MNLSNWLTIAGITIGVLLAVYAFIYRLDHRVSAIENRCVTHQPVIDSIAQLNSRLDKIAADNETFWRILGPSLAGIIHSPTAHDRDELVDRLMHHPESMTCPDLDAVIGLLQAAIEQPAWSAEKRLVGAMVLARATQLRTHRTRECA